MTIDPTQFPDAVRRGLAQSFSARAVNHKYHYDSVKQTAAWLRLHEACSPARTDPDCAAIYEISSAAAASRCAGQGTVQLIGLGCGGGWKDARLLRQLREAGARKLAYVPCDVSAAMVLTARSAAMESISAEDCLPFVCDLAEVSDLGRKLDELLSDTSEAGARLITFFGMIPNFEPELIMPVLSGCVREKDLLLFSANLAPGPDYEAGIARILPLYDNELTRRWLMLLPIDSGIAEADGRIRFEITPSSSRPDLKRVQASFEFAKPVEIEIEGEKICFAAGEAIRLFFSYRHTPDLARTMLSAHGLVVVDQWLAPSGEEGVFLCRRG